MTAAVQTIRLYGELGKKFGRVHRLALDTNSAAEAVRALRAMHAGLGAYLANAHHRGIGFAVFRGKENLTKEQLDEPAGGGDIRIAPIIMGSKNGGVFNIILGAVLIVAGYVLAPYTGGASLNLVPVGVSMIVGGVVQLLTPMPKGPKNTDSPDNKPSYVFTGAVNTQAQGNPVPLLYGRMIVGSAVISAGINAEDYSAATAGVGDGYTSDKYQISDPILGWNPKTPYDTAPEAV